MTLPLCLFLSVWTIFTRWEEHKWDSRQTFLCMCEWGHERECKGKCWVELFVIILSSKGRSVQCVVGGKSNRTVTLSLIRDQSLCWNCFPSLLPCLNSLYVSLTAFLWIFFISLLVTFKPTYYTRLDNGDTELSVGKSSCVGSDVTGVMSGVKYDWGLIGWCVRSGISVAVCHVVLASSLSFPLFYEI